MKSAMLRGQWLCIALIGALALFSPVAVLAQVRVASLAPNLTELICELGFYSNLVGRSSVCDYPPEVRTVRVVGDFGRPNWEVLAGIKPDLVVATDLERPAMLKPLVAMGVRAELLPCESWDQLMHAARVISEALGAPERGESWCRRMTEQREALEREVRDYYGTRSKPRVYVEIWHHPLTTAGEGSFLNELITLAGGSNLAANLPMRYPHVSSEWVVTQDPDVVLLAYMLPIGQAEEALKTRVGWSGLRVFRSGGVVSDIPPELLLRPGPRSFEGAWMLAERLMAWDRQNRETQAPSTAN